MLPKKLCNCYQNIISSLVFTNYISNSQFQRDRKTTYTRTQDTNKMQFSVLNYLAATSAKYNLVALISKSVKLLKMNFTLIVLYYV